MASTIKAAPIMLGVGHLGDDTAALQQAYDQFTFWGVYVRGTAIALVLSTVWALAAQYRQPAPTHTGLSSTSTTVGT